MQELSAHVDFETASACELKSAGVHKYAEHASTRVWGFRYFIGPKYAKPTIHEMKQWRPGWADPTDLLLHIMCGGLVVAHNAMFERTIWNVTLRRNYPLKHWPLISIEQQDCTLARCAAIAIPGSLDVASQVLGARANKDMEGHSLMMRMARPRSRTVCAACSGTGVGDGSQPMGFGPCETCRGTGETYTWWDDPAMIERNMLYCAQDVVTECEVDTLAPALTAYERRVWIHDQRVNDRGIKLDIPTIRRAIALRDTAKKQLNAEMRRVTGGIVEKCTQTKKLVEWINGLGIQCTSIAKDKQAAVLADADEELDDDLEFMLGESLLPNSVQRAMEVRQQANKTSTAKLDAMLKCACDDGRARGLFQYHGTSTGRYAGRLIQPHNLARIDAKRDGESVRRTVELLLQYHDPNDAHFMVSVLVGPPMAMLSKALRGMLIADEGKMLYGADLSNIEGRIAAWLTGEQWKLDAFLAYDMKVGPDLYVLSYARSFQIAIEIVTDFQRQQGKVQELSLGYQGSVGAFLNMGKNYGLKPGDLVEPVRAVTPDLDWANMWAAYPNARDKHKLPQDQWTAIKLIVGAWRAAHPKLTATWRELQDAAIEAVSNPDRVVYVMGGKGAYLCTRGFLWAQLPSGRVLAYSRPRINYVMSAWIEYDDGRPDFVIEDYNEEHESMWQYVALYGGNTEYAVSNSLHLTHGVVPDMRGGGKLIVRSRRRVDYDGFDGEKKRWGTFSLYGGMQFNHFDQGSARDVLFEGMERLEAADYPVVFHCHDEAVAEVDANSTQHSANQFASIFAQNPAWLAGCPLAAAGWGGVRYGK